MIVESFEDVVSLSGPLNADHWETIHVAVALLLKRHPSGVIIDCSQISSVNRHGAETFRHILKYVLSHKEGRIVVAAVPPDVLEVARTVPDVRSQLPLSASVEEARRSLQLYAVDGEGKRKRKERVYTRKLLACVASSTKDDSMLHTLCETLDREQTQIVLLIPIVVPRDLPLQSPMPEMELAAKDFSNRAKAVFDSHEVGHEVLIDRTRDLPTLVSEVAVNHDVTRVVVGLGTDSTDEAARVKLFKGLDEKVTRPLVVIRGPIERAPREVVQPRP